MLTLLALCGGVVLATGIGAVVCCILSSRMSRAEQDDPDAEQRAQDAARATAAAWEAAIIDGHKGDW